MSNVNDNNLDDLLRRAAEKYPLRTDSADWGKLVSDLERDPSLILPPVNGEDRRRRRRFFWLFLLLPLAGVGYYAWHAGKAASLAGREDMVQASGQAKPAEQSGEVKLAEQSGQMKSGEESGEKKLEGESKEKKSGGQGEDKKSRGPGEEKKLEGQRGEVKAAEQREPARSGEESGEKRSSGQREVMKSAEQSGDKKSGGRSGEIKVAEQRDGKSKVEGKDGQAVATVARDGRTVRPDGRDVSVARDREGQVRGERDQANVRPGQRGQVGGGSERESQTGRSDQKHVAGLRGLTSGAEQTSRAGMPAGVSGQQEEGLHLAGNTMQRAGTKVRGDVSANQIPLKSPLAGQVKDNGKKDNNIKLQKPKPSFYVGILGSPDLSTIKWQSVKNVGTRVGLLLGYSFNSRWSIESGAYYSKKKYYTDGEYFDKTNAYILKYVDQLKVDGVCNMWEFPVNVRYNLSTGPKMKWFATAGASAYYMSREKYDCSGYLNGAAWSEEWNKKPSHNSWSANLNLSVGYEQRVGKIGSLRLEPYVRVPMSGIGTGKLSIMSAGLNIGITRRIW